MLAPVLAVWIGCLALGLAVTAEDSMRTVRARPYSRVTYQDLRRMRPRWVSLAGMLLAIVGTSNIAGQFGRWVTPAAAAMFLAALEIPRLLHNAAVRRSDTTTPTPRPST